MPGEHFSVRQIGEFKMSIKRLTGLKVHEQVLLFQDHQLTDNIRPSIEDLDMLAEHGGLVLRHRDQKCGNKRLFSKGIRGLNTFLARNFGIFYVAPQVQPPPPPPPPPSHTFSLLPLADEDDPIFTPIASPPPLTPGNYRDSFESPSFHIPEISGLSASTYSPDVVRAESPPPPQSSATHATALDDDRPLSDLSDTDEEYGPHAPPPPPGFTPVCLPLAPAAAPNGSDPVSLKRLRDSDSEEYDDFDDEEEGGVRRYPWPSYNAPSVAAVLEPSSNVSVSSPPPDPAVTEVEADPAPPRKRLCRVADGECRLDFGAADGACPAGQQQQASRKPHVYFIGIVDILQKYNMVKWFERRITKPKQPRTPFSPSIGAAAPPGILTRSTSMTPQPSGNRSLPSSPTGDAPPFAFPPPPAGALQVSLAALRSSPADSGDATVPPQDAQSPPPTSPMPRLEFALSLGGLFGGSSATLDSDAAAAAAAAAPQPLWRRERARSVSHLLPTSSASAAAGAGDARTPPPRTPAAVPLPLSAGGGGVGGSGTDAEVDAAWRARPPRAPTDSRGFASAAAAAPVVPEALFSTPEVSVEEPGRYATRLMRYMAAITV
ncbi:hypothetical protein HK405_003654 [Cladochytrium tenue]|nr:hypothetical protein HK405_003654 [Cladochytrium tenue]